MVKQSYLRKIGKPVIKTLRDERKPISPAVMNGILRAPMWHISDARIHEAGRIRTPQGAIKWIQAVIQGDEIDRARIELGHE